MRKIIYTKALIDLIAGCIFDGLTDEETSILSKVPQKQISRLRLGEDCPAIREATVQRMRVYIALIRDGNDRTNHWQRIAWFLERRYPDRWAKPEVLLNLNTGAQVTNQTLVITAEQAADFKTRNAAVDQELAKLTPPGAPNRPLESFGEVKASPPDSQTLPNQDQTLNNLGSLFSVRESSDSKDGSNVRRKASSTSLSSNTRGTGAAPGTRTPYAAPDTLEPNLPPKSKSVETSRNYKSATDSPAVENSGNSRKIPRALEPAKPPGGIKEKKGMVEKLRKPVKSGGK